MMRMRNMRLAALVALLAVVGVPPTEAQQSQTRSNTDVNRQNYGYQSEGWYDSSDRFNTADRNTNFRNDFGDPASTFDRRDRNRAGDFGFDRRNNVSRRADSRDFRQGTDFTQPNFRDQRFTDDFGRRNFRDQRPRRDVLRTEFRNRRMRGDVRRSDFMGRRPSDSFGRRDYGYDDRNFGYGTQDYDYGRSRARYDGWNDNTRRTSFGEFDTRRFGRGDEDYPYGRTDYETSDRRPFDRYDDNRTARFGYSSEQVDPYGSVGRTRDFNDMTDDTNVYYTDDWYDDGDSFVRWYEDLRRRNA